MHFPEIAQFRLLQACGELILIVPPKPPMPPENIAISNDVTLYPQRADVKSQPPVTRERALRLLREAKGNTATMAELRALLRQPVSHQTDEQVLEQIATAVSLGQMVLEAGDLGRCTSDKERFFEWLEDDLRDMAANLNTTLQLVLTLAVKEGGWNKPALDHNQPLNNPFGMNIIKNRQAAGNAKYQSLKEAVDAWTSSHAYVRGIKDPAVFVKALLDHHYNTVNPHYGKEFVARYDDVGRAMKSCKVSP